MTNRRASRCTATGRRAALLVAAVLLTGCSGPTGEGQPGPPSAPAVGAAASSSRAAELEAGLTSALVERVHTTATVRRAVLSAGSDTTSAAPVLAALDAGSVALADLVGATYEDARTPLLLALRRTDRLQVADALAAPGPDATFARNQLEAGTADLAAVLRRIVPALEAEEVTDRLLGDLRAQLDARGDAPYGALHEATNRARDTARLLAAAVAEDRRLGPSGTRAAALRADLTGLLTEHVLLTGALAGELSAAGRLSPGAESVREALQANAQALALTLGVAYPAAREPFARAWAVHLGRLEAYATAAPGLDPQAEAALRASPRDLAQVFAEPVDGLPTGRLAEELTPLVDAQLTALQAAARRSPTATADLRAAAVRASVPAALLAASIAQHLRLG